MSDDYLTMRETLRRIAQPVPRGLVSEKRLSGNAISFVSWYDACDIMDERAPGWSYTIREVGDIAGKVYMIVRVSVPCADGELTREATGNEDDEVRGYGDPWSNAESMALRRAFAKFGLGRELYQGDGGKWRRAIIQRERDNAAETVAEHAAKLAGDEPVEAKAIDTTNGVVRDITPSGEVVEAEGYTARIGAAHGDPDKLAAILKELATATDINDHRRAHAFANAAERLSGAVGIETAGEVTPTRLEWLAMVLGWTEKTLGGDVCAAQRERADAARQDVAVALAAVKAMQGEAVAVPA